MSFYPFFERLGVTFTTVISHGILSFCYILLTLKTCNSSTNNQDKSSDIMFVWLASASLQHRQLDEWTLV